MIVECMLSCKNISQQLKLDLSDCLLDMSSVDLSKCDTVFEDGTYDIYFTCDEYSRNDIDTVDVCVNGEKIGNIVLNNTSKIVDGNIKYRKDILAEQPFLLRYDFVVLSFTMKFNDGSSKEYFTSYLLCVSRSQEDTENIQKMLQELIAFNDSQIGEWIFSETKQNISSGLYEGKWNNRAYKSLTSYIQLLERVIICYKNNYIYFKTQRKHTIERVNVLTSYKNARRTSRDNFNWIIQNADQLAEVYFKSGIYYNGKNYLPYLIKTDVSKKSGDVYENRVIIGFLHTVLLNAKQIKAEFNRDVLNEEQIFSRILGKISNEYHAPIITIKSLQVSFCRILLEKLSQSINTLENIYKQYVKLFDVPISELTTFPRRTSTFCEIKPYIQVFEIILYWFRYGEYSLEKERLILQVKTLDKLFEYYCLIHLLKLLAENGYQKSDTKEPVFKYEYTSADKYYINEKDVANTYMLSNGSVSLTLYYQPVISSKTFENGLKLYRTTGTRYFTPDFVLKFKSLQSEEEYVIFDAKFSKRETIKNYRLPEAILKYSSEIAVASNSHVPKMVWILQGRVNSNENVIFRYHNSPLSSQFQPITSYGIASINTAIERKQYLWNEIKKNISFL